MKSRRSAADATGTIITSTPTTSTPTTGTIRGRRGGGRARRGKSKYLLMDALRDAPKHGYEIIKSLEERSGGR